MANSSMDITPNIITIGSRIIQTKNVSSVTVTRSVSKLLFWLFAILLLVGFIILSTLTHHIALWIIILPIVGYFLFRYANENSSLYYFIISTNDGKVTALESRDKQFMVRILIKAREALTTSDATFAYHINVDKRNIVQGNQINLENVSDDAIIAGGNIFK